MACLNRSVSSLQINHWYNMVLYNMVLFCMYQVELVDCIAVCVALLFHHILLQLIVCSYQIHNSIVCASLHTVCC